MEQTTRPTKTADELDIQQWELTQLVSVRNMLATKKLLKTDFRGSLRFDMNLTAAHDDDCGTVCCIGGSMYAQQFGDDVDGILMFDFGRADSYVTNHPKLRPLFFPPGSAYDDITEAQAVEAIDNFLATGDPDWESILGVEDEEGV